MGKLPFLALGLAGLAACGKVQGFADASITADGSDVDAPVDAVPFGMVTVDVRTTTNDGLPQIGATVLFVDTDGNQIRVAAGQDGKASAMVHPGATVTAVWLLASGPRLVTILGVEPGDELRVGTDGPADQTASAPTTLTVPETGAPSQKWAYTSCGQTLFEGTTVTLPWQRYCEQDNADILVISNDARGAASQYLYVGNVANDQRATVAATGPWRSFELFNIAYTDVPAGSRYLNVRRRLRTGARDLYTSYGGGEILSATPSYALPTAPLAGDDMEIITDIYPNSTDELRYGPSLIRQRLPVNTSLQVRLVDHALPFVTQSTLDLATKTITWLQAEGGASADAVVVDNYYFRTDGDAGTQTSTSWRVIAPGGTTTLTLPDLPVELAELMPRPTDTTYNGTVTLLASSDHDYRAIRQALDIDYYEWAYGYSDIVAATVSVSGVFND